MFISKSTVDDGIDTCEATFIGSDMMLGSALRLYLKNNKQVQFILCVMTDGC